MLGAALAGESSKGCRWAASWRKAGLVKLALARWGCRLVCCRAVRAAGGPRGPHLILEPRQKQSRRKRAVPRRPGV